MKGIHTLTVREGGETHKNVDSSTSPVLANSADRLMTCRPTMKGMHTQMAKINTPAQTVTPVGDDNTSLEPVSEEVADLAASTALGSMTPIAEGYAIIESKIDSITDPMVLGKLGLRIMGAGKMGFSTLCHLVDHAWTLSVADGQTAPSKEAFETTIEDAFGQKMSATHAYNLRACYQNVIKAGIDISDPQIMDSDVIAASKIKAVKGTGSAGELLAIEKRREYLEYVAEGKNISDQQPYERVNEITGERTTVVPMRMRPWSGGEKASRLRDIKGVTRDTNGANPENREAPSQTPGQDLSKAVWIFTANDAKVSVAVDPNANYGFACLAMIADNIHRSQGQTKDWLQEIKAAVAYVEAQRESALQDPEPEAVAS